MIGEWKDEEEHLKCFCANFVCFFFPLLSSQFTHQSKRRYTLWVPFFFFLACPSRYIQTSSYRVLEFWTPQKLWNQWGLTEFDLIKRSEKKKKKNHLISKIVTVNVISFVSVFLNGFFSPFLFIEKFLIGWE